jgi:hypothetical protein
MPDIWAAKALVPNAYFRPQMTKPCIRNLTHSMYKGRSEFFLQCDNELKHWSYQSTGVDYLPSQLDAVLQVANSWGIGLVLVMSGASL